MKNSGLAFFASIIHGMIAFFAAFSGTNKAVLVFNCLMVFAWGFRSIVSAIEESGHLWQANCRRSLQGRSGQRELSVLRDALLALPDKRLIHGSLQDEDGEVCAIGAYAKHKGMDLKAFDPESDTDEVGIAGGMPKLVAWKVVEMNDMEFGRYSWAEPLPVTPERRYQLMLAWVESQLGIK